MRTTVKREERGGVIVLAMIVLASLSILAGLTVVATESNLATTKTQRFHDIAEYAAESGAAAAMVYLKDKFDLTGTGTKYTAQISAGNTAPLSPSGIPGNGVASGAPGNPFSQDMRASYSVMLLNNRADPGFASGFDTDGIIQIYVTGYGPDGSVSSMSWEVQGTVGVGAPLTLVGWSNVL